VLQRLNMAPPATSHCALQLLQENIYGRGNGDNPLKNAPHTHELLLEPEWTHPYTKVFPDTGNTSGQILAAGRSDR
jgi:hypothetical protein